MICQKSSLSSPINLSPEHYWTVTGGTLYTISLILLHSALGCRGGILYYYWGKAKHHLELSSELSQTFLLVVLSLTFL